MAEVITLTEEQLKRLEALEQKVQSLSRQALRHQNKDDFGVACRYLARLIHQLRQDLGQLAPYLENTEASLNLLETRM